MKIINFLIIGLGKIGSTHLENIIDNKDINIVSISGTNITKLNFFKKKYNLNKYSNNSHEVYKFFDKYGFNATIGHKQGHYDEVFSE